eukprot:4341492-Pyramimonas_sp.AAC.1
MHRVWPCPSNRDHDDYEKSDALLPSALARAEADPACWLRGLAARADTRPVFRDLGRDGGWS